MEKPSWVDEAIRLRFTVGLSWTELAREMQPFFPDLTEKQVWERVRTRLRESEEYKAARNTTDETPEPKQEKPAKVEVSQNFEPTVIKSRWRGQKTIRFGLMGDTQINSKYTQLTHLHDFYDICEESGIKDVYHTGDLDEGEQMRTGHQYECYTQGADDHVSEIVKTYPQRDGITTHFITGNHDASILKRCGHNIGNVVGASRPDMNYLGQDCAIVQLTPNCSMLLMHPWDGSAYSISYKPQKIAEALQGGEKPNILAIGHYHKAEYLFYRNIHIFQTGTFQAQTPFMRGKSIAAMMGGWIVEVKLDADGSIVSVKQEFIPYYKPIKDDYKNFLNW